jgi:prepilin-type N-terminal cleavage/methylation domain-containing protein
MTSQMRDSRGFSLIELLVSMFIMTVVLGLSTRALIQTMHTDEAIGLMADANQSLQSAQTMMVRDMVDAGRNLDLGGLSFPSGGGTPIVRPGPPNAATAGWPVPAKLWAVTPGNELGPQINGNNTDTVTIVSVDDSLQHGDGARMVIDVNGANVTMTQDPDFPVTPRNTPRVGDLLLVVREQKKALINVTWVDPNNSLIFRAYVAGDTSNLNQLGATAGSMMQVGSSALDPADPAGIARLPDAQVIRIKMTTYWVEEAAGMPYLMRQDNYRAPLQVALGMENLEVEYDVWLNGVATRVDNYTEVLNATPNNFDKARVSLAVRSDKRFGQTKTFLRNNLTTQVSFRSLQVKLNFQ